MNPELSDTEDLVDDPVDALIVECLGHPPAAREAALTGLCARHPDHAGPLRARYRFLVEAGLIEDAAAARLASPERLGDYRVVRLLGHGGMGVVYLAEDERDGRQVALKVIQPGVGASPRARARFRREIEAISQLDHPFICRVYEAGEIEGVPYLAMRYCEGETLAQRIARQTAASRGAPPADAPGAVEALVLLGERLARALHAVHEAGVVHRDVKPGNVLIDAASGAPQLLDFGLAQLDDGEQPTLTLSGDRLGTPAYMAPEQVAGHPADRRTDVYALGATLYEALTGRAVHSAPTREALFRRILEGEITHASRHNPHVPRDLAVVLATALERDPDRRYRTAAELADDLERVRERAPVAARAPGAWRRARRWCRRNPYAATAFGVLVAGLATTAGLLEALTGRMAERDAALQTREAFGQLALDPGAALASARRAWALDPTPAAMAALRASVHAPQVEREFALAHKADISFTCRIGEGPADEVLAWCDRDGRELRIWRRGAFAPPFVLRGELGKFCVRISPAGDRVAVAGWDAPATVHDLDGRLLHELPLPEDAVEGTAVLSVAWHPAGDRIAVGVGDTRMAGDDARFEVHLWRLGPGAPTQLWRREVGAWPWLLRFVDADTLVVAPGANRTSSRDTFRDHDVRALRVADGSVRRSHDRHSQPCMELAVHGSLVATAGHDGRLVLWDVESGEEIVREHPARVYTVDVAPDGQQVATACADGVVRLFDRAGGDVEEWAPHGAMPVKSAVFTPEGDALLVNHVQGRELRTLDGRLLTRLPKGTASVRNDWFLDRDRLATVDRYAVRIWRLRPPDLGVVAHSPEQLPVFSPSGTRHAPGGHDGANRACIDDEGRVYRVTDDRRILVHDAEGRLECESKPWLRPIILLGVAPTGGFVAGSGNGRNVRVVRRRADGTWSDAGPDLGIPQPPPPGRERIGHSPFRWLRGEDGAWRILLGTWRGIVEYELRTATDELRFLGAVLEDEVVQAIAVAPDERRIAANLEMHGIVVLTRVGESWVVAARDASLRADHIAFAGAERLLLTTRDEVRILDLDLRHVDTVPNLDGVGLVSARGLPGGAKIATLAANGIEREWWLDGKKVLEAAGRD